jgi:hypothetical protein
MAARPLREKENTYTLSAARTPSTSNGMSIFEAIHDLY